MTRLADIRILAIDLDGTALSSDRRLETPTVEALSEAIGNGLSVVFVSARPLWSLRARTASLTAPTSAVAAGGAVVVEDTDRVLHHQPIPEPTMEAVADRLHAWGLSALVYRDAATFRIGDSAALRAEAAETGRDEDLCWSGGHADKVLAFDEPGWDALRALERHDGLHVSRSHGRYVEVNAAGADKGSALRHLLRFRNLTPSQLAAIGDGDNDVAMLKLAGRAYAVANASSGARAAAHAIVPTNDEHGVARLAKAWLKEEDL